MTKNEVMAVVKRMCNLESIGCRSLNKSKDARILMDGLNVPKNAEIWEIPVDWNDAVLIVFEIPNDHNYYTLFAGIGTDGNYYYNISIEGTIIDGQIKPFEKDGIILSKDYFCK